MKPTSSLTTELWSIKQELTLAKEIGYKELEVETYGLLVLKLIKEDIQCHSLRTIIQDCKHLWEANKTTINIYRGRRTDVRPKMHILFYYLPHILVLSIVV